MRSLRTIVVACAPLLALGFFAQGCGSDDGGEQGESSSSGAATSATSMTGATNPSTGEDSASVTTAVETTAADSSSSDGPPPDGECILWEPDECGEGRKCMPFSLEADRIPDLVQCCDAVENPALDGEPCTAMTYNGSCLDNCAPGSMCVLDDEDALGGLCRKFCEPGPNNECEFDQTCKSFFELLPGVPTTPLCMDTCDPLLQDCSPNGWHCIPDTPTESGQSGFLCSPPPPSAPKGLFAPCALANDCEAGLVCITQDRVPDCPFSACCTAYCSLSEGDAICETLNADMECVDWMSPDPDWFDVGACAIP